MPGFVSIVGAGPWDAELITLAGVRRLQRADVVLADYLVNPNLLLHAPARAEIVQRVRGPGGGPHLRQHELDALMIEHARGGRYVVRLKGGDPCMFGRGGEEARVLRRAGIDFEFVPGVTSPVAAPEAAGIPVTHRDHTPAVTFVSGYEAYDKLGLHVEWQHLARGAGTLVLMMSVDHARENAERLIAAGRAPTTPAAVVRWGTRGIQRTVVGTLATIADLMQAEGIRAPAVLVVGEVVNLRAELAWMERRPLFGRRIVLTRAADRSSGLLEILTARGADVLAFPCLAFAPPEDEDAFMHAVAHVHDHDGVIVSSPNGASVFFSALAHAGLDARALAGKAVVAIGEGTASRCREHGIAPDLVPGAAHSEGLALALRTRGWLTRAWLHVRADEGRPELAHAITAAGGRYTLAVGYRSIRPRVHGTVVRSLLPPHEGGEGFDAVVFTSGKAATHFVASVDEELGAGAALRLLARAHVVSIGPVTTTALQKLGIAVAATADSPREDALVAALASVLPPSA